MKTEVNYAHHDIPGTSTEIPFITFPYKQSTPRFFQIKLQWMKGKPALYDMLALCVTYEVLCSQF